MIKKITLYSFGLILVFFTFSCSPRISNSVLAFLFDGVPEPVDSSTIILDNNVPDPALVLSASEVRETKPTFILHEPYKIKECNQCHDENSVGNLTDGEPELCYGCHRNFNEIYKFLHGPVSGGFCTSCHDPHMSYNDKLLVETGNELCFLCHDQLTVYLSEPHLEKEVIGCSECHNPHGNNNSILDISQDRK